MNEKIRRQISMNNPFVFKHISNLKSIDHFEDVGACVIMASPGMMRSGFSRELFESWCVDTRNTCIIAGYCVEGTFAKQVHAEPEEIGTKIARIKLSISHFQRVQIIIKQVKAFVLCYRDCNV